MVKRVRRRCRCMQLNRIPGKYGDGPDPDYPDDIDFASGGIARMLGE
jgi:hypothetical protein